MKTINLADGWKIAIEVKKFQFTGFIIFGKKVNQDE
jgi:hypothetical protein